MVAKIQVIIICLAIGLLFAGCSADNNEFNEATKLSESLFEDNVQLKREIVLRMVWGTD